MDETEENDVDYRIDPEQAQKDFKDMISREDIDNETELTEEFEQLLARYLEIEDGLKEIGDVMVEESEDETVTVDITNNNIIRKMIRNNREIAAESLEIYEEMNELLAEVGLDLDSDILGMPDWDRWEEELGSEIRTIGLRTQWGGMVIYKLNEFEESIGIFTKLKRKFSN